METDRPVARRFFEWCGENLPGTGGKCAGLQRPISCEPWLVLSSESFSCRSSGGSGGGGAEGDSAFDLYAGVGLFPRLWPIASGRSPPWNPAPAPCGTCCLMPNAPAWPMFGGGRMWKNSCTSRTVQRDFVLLDPPRAGVGKAVVRRLVELRPPAVDPGSLRPCHAGARLGRIGWERLCNRSYDDGGSLPTDLPSGNDRALRAHLGSLHLVYISE